VIGGNEQLVPLAQPERAEPVPESVAAAVIKAAAILVVGKGKRLPP
jgi:hypothetical protein